MNRRLRFSQYTILVVALIGTQVMLLAQTTHGANQREHSSVVPFVGCKADGQAGALEAPQGRGKVVPIDAAKAEWLAYYKAELGFGVLAPRGWNCFETYGSSGGSLFISPQPIDAGNLLSEKGFTGPVIQLATEVGGTSGRFGVARTIARVFPDHRAFVRKVIAEGIEPASDFPFGPHPNDKLVYKNKEMVEYETPAHADGLGTQSRLQKNADPIRGVAFIVGPDTDLISLSVRLPREIDDLTSIIIQQVEREAAAETP